MVPSHAAPAAGPRNLGPRKDEDDDEDGYVSVPLVVDKRGKSEELVDLYSRLLRDRVIFLGGPVGRHMAQVVTAQILFLSHDDPQAEISIYINSPGGSISDGLAIIDAMRSVPCSTSKSTSWNTTCCRAGACRNFWCASSTSMRQPTPRCVT